MKTSEVFWMFFLSGLEELFDMVKADDEIWIDIRRQLIAEENSRDKSQQLETYSNGETMRQILARSKHTLIMSRNKWNDIQHHRANIHAPTILNYS